MDIAVYQSPTFDLAMGAIVGLAALYLTASFLSGCIFQTNGKHIGSAMLVLAALFVLVTAQSLRAFGYRSDSVSVSAVENAYDIDILKESPDGRGKETAFDIDKKDTTTITYGATVIEYAKGDSVRHGILVISKTDNKDVAHVELYPTDDAVTVSPDDGDNKSDTDSASTGELANANADNAASDAKADTSSNVNANAGNGIGATNTNE